MKKLKHYINNSNISRFRIIIQIIAFGLLVYGGLWSISISERIPTFACPYNKCSGGTCYLIALQHQMHMEAKWLFSFRGLGIITGLITFLVFFVFLNKAWCGFICPLGFIQDLITKFREKLGIRFSRFNQNSFKKLGSIKYILLVLIIIIPFGISNSLFGLPKFSEDLAAPFCQICPGRTVLPLFHGSFAEFYIDMSNSVSIFMGIFGMMVTALFFAGSFFKKRFFCFICPMSGLQYLFSKLGFLRLIKTGEKCTRCGNCSRVCDIGITEIADNIEKKNIVTDDCMMCFKCVEACPEDKCLKVSFLGLSLFESTGTGFYKRYVGNKNYEINNTDLKSIRKK